MEENTTSDTPTASTLRCYVEDWKCWCAWCAPQDIDPLRCTVSDVIAAVRDWHTAGLALSTIGRRKAAIGYFHRQVGAAALVNDYALRSVMSVLRRGAPPQRGKFPISKSDLDRIIRNCEADPRRLIGLRDRAIFAVGWSCALRRSALAALRVADLSGRRRLPNLSLEARNVALEWLKAARVSDGPLFRRPLTRRLRGRGKPAVDVVGESLSAHGIARIVKLRCAAIGKHEAEFSVSSVRKGRVVHEVRRGTGVREIIRIAQARTVNDATHAIRTAVRAAR